MNGEIMRSRGVDCCVYGALAMGIIASDAFAQESDSGLPTVTITGRSLIDIDEPSTAGSRLGLTPLETPASVAIVDGDLPGPIVYPANNTGLHAHTGLLADVGKFRVPTLRNIAVTAPYMHDGSIPTLEKVLDHYANGGRAPNPLLSESIRPIALSATERNDLIAFLNSLTDEEALRDPRWSDPWKSQD